MGSNHSQPICVIGLGAIGQGMAQNLLRAGYRVHGCEPDEHALATFVAAGGIPFDVPSEAAADCSIALICVFDDAQAESVLFGPQGIADHLTPAGIAALHTTTSPARAQALATRWAALGHAMIDAPVTGGKAGADNGTLTIMAAGLSEALETLAPVFEIVGSKVYVAGEQPGQATKLKMVNQLLTGVHLAAAAEAVAFADAMGVDQALVYDIITRGTGTSHAFETRSEAMRERDFRPRGMVDIFTKDLDIVVDLAADTGAAAPLAQEALARFRRAAALGHGRSDSAAVLMAYLSARDDG